MSPFRWFVLWGLLLASVAARMVGVVLLIRADKISVGMEGQLLSMKSEIADKLIQQSENITVERIVERGVLRETGQAIKATKIENVTVFRITNGQQTQILVVDNNKLH